MGKLIVIEGLDGSGKSTQLNLLEKQIIWLLVTVIIAWFIIELISNWGAFTSGFQEGLNQ